MSTQNRTIQATFKAVDAFTSVSNRVIQSSNKVTAATKKLKNTIILNAKDMVTNVVDKVKGKLTGITNSRGWKVLLAVKDMVTNTLSKITNNLKSFAGKIHRATVSVKDNASGVLGGLKGKLLALAGGITVTVMAKIGFDGLAAEQNQKITINRVIENSGKTKEQAKKATEEYYKYLEEFANSTPFSTADVAVMGTKSMMLAKGNVTYAKTLTDAMANTKAFVGDMKTSAEIAEAFFSAGNGNMDSLNNILGEQYETLDKALTGIAKKQGGLTDEMANTVGGLWSTVMGKTQAGLKDIVKQFEPMISGALGGVISAIDKFLPKIINAFGNISKFVSDLMNGDSSKFPVIENIKNAIKTIVPVFENIKKVISKTIEGMFSSVKTNFGSIGKIIEGASSFIIPIIQNLMPVFAGIGVVFDSICRIATSIWPVISGVITTASEIIGEVLEYANPIIGAIGTVCENIGKIISTVWPSIKETIMTVWDNLKPVFELFEGLVQSIANFVKEHWPTIATVIEKMWVVASVPLTLMSDMLGGIATFVQDTWDKFKGFNEWWNTTKWNPGNWFNVSDAQAKSNAYGGQQNTAAMNAGKGKFAFGLKRVPVDNYKTVLHAGERVLTAQEARQIDNKNEISGNVNISVSNLIVREEADIDKIAQIFIKRLKEERIAFGGKY